jgi:hypothetical protein
MAVEQKPLRVHYWWRAPGSRAPSSQATSTSAEPKVCPPWPACHPTLARTSGIWREPNPQTLIGAGW